MNCTNSIPFDAAVDYHRAPVGVIDQIMGTHGMYGLSEMLSGGQPLDPFMTPQQVTDTSSFFRWLEQREGEMTILAEARDAELTSWAAGHVAAFKMVRHLLHCYSASDISGMSRHFLSGYEGALRRKMHITFTGVKSGEAHDLALGNSAAWHSVVLAWRKASNIPPTSENIGGCVR